MSKFLLYTTIQNQIQDEMASQAPDVSKILRAANAEILNLSTKYDIDTFIRNVSISVVTDGTEAYEIGVVTSRTDVRKIKSIRYTDETIKTEEIVPVDYDAFMSDVNNYVIKNQFTVYYKDGKEYIRIMTSRNSSTVENLTVRYFTSNLAIDDNGNYYEKIVSGGIIYALIPENYLDLVSLGAQKRLFYQSIGDGDSVQTSIVRNRYDSELKKLGLSDIAKTIERKENKIKLRKSW